MTFDPRLANITVPVVHGLYCPFFQISGKKKVLHEITVYSQAQLNPFSPIVGSSAKTQRHIITSPDT